MKCVATWLLGQFLLVFGVMGIAHRLCRGDHDHWWSKGDVFLLLVGLHLFGLALKWEILEEVRKKTRVGGRSKEGLFSCGNTSERSGSGPGVKKEIPIFNLAEFGRTPRINPAGRRDHWPQCWTVYLAGGGVKGGRGVGRRDEIGAYPVERPIAPKEIVATIYHALGLDLGTHPPGPAGCPFPLVDFGTQPIRELL